MTHRCLPLPAVAYRCLPLLAVTSRGGAAKQLPRANVSDNVQPLVALSRLVYDQTLSQVTACNGT